MSRIYGTFNGRIISPTHAQRLLDMADVARECGVRADAEDKGLEQRAFAIIKTKKEREDSSHQMVQTRRERAY